MTKLEELQAKMAVLKEEMKVAYQESLREGFEKVFQEFPKLESFAWAQYTPFFNDGEECVFDVHTDFFWLRGIEAEQLSYQNGNDETIYYSEDDDKHGEEFGDYTEVPWREDRANTGRQTVAAWLQTVLDAQGEDFLKEAFGNHVVVTVHRDGNIDTDEYDHE